MVKDHLSLYYHKPFLQGMEGTMRFQDSASMFQMDSLSIIQACNIDLLSIKYQFHLMKD